VVTKKAPSKGARAMTQQSAPIYVILSVENMTQAQVAEINALTHELGIGLENQPDAVASISFGGKNDLPQGTKVALEAILAEQIVLRVAPIVTNWVLGKIEGSIKSLSERIGRQVNAKVIVGNREVLITPKTTPQELNKAAQQVKAISELAPNRRFALVIGNSNYQDERLPDLKSAVVDAERFATVLLDPNLGAFTQVDTLINKMNGAIENAIEKFFKNKLREDMLLLYFSGHGIKSQNGQLFLAAQNTNSDFLRSTGIAANFIKENMGESGSQRQILLLDCCYGGAIVEGAKSDTTIGQTVNSILSFRPSGFGKIIITASEAMQYAFDGKHVEGQTQNSLFTRYLIEGLESGKADADNDGLIDINELYQFAYDNVTPQQTPNISATSQEGRMYIGLNPNPSIQMAQLPEHLQQAMLSETRLHRQGAVSELARMLKSADPSMVLSAEMALRKMTNDDSKSVADYAQETLDQYFRARTVIPQQMQGQQLATPKSSAPENVASVPHPSVTSPYRPRTVIKNVPPKVASTLPTKQKNVSLGGLMNVILPGAAQAYAGNWGRALVVFMVMAILVLILFGIGDSTICASALIIEIIYMFLAGRNIIIRYNRKIGN
jgi:uncharacterized caspase-like protein